MSIYLIQYPAILILCTLSLIMIIPICYWHKAKPAVLMIAGCILILSLGALFFLCFYYALPLVETALLMLLLLLVAIYGLLRKGGF